MKKKILQTLFLILIIKAVTAQDTQIKGFADANYIYTSDTSGSENAFRFHQFDLYYTSQITEKISFIVETVFEFENMGVNVDIARVIMKYSLSDHLNLSFGRFYTPIGYWNKAYVHGSVLQPEIERPQIVATPMDGGLLPIHENGLQLEGNGFTNKNIGFNLLVSNGIASSAIADDNESKSVTINLHAEPIENLTIYISGYIDQIPKGYTTNQGVVVNKNTDFQVFNSSVVYKGNKIPIEFVGEYYNLRNNLDSTTSKSFKSANGFITILGVHIKKFTPYICYDGIMFQNQEQYFIKNNISQYRLGIRYNFSALSVLKLEYRYIDTKKIETMGAMSSSTGGGIQQQVELQFAIGF